MTRRWVVTSLLLAASALVIPCFSADLQVGDRLPDCSKIPLVPVDQAYHPEAGSVASLEKELLADGVTILHFCSPRPRRHFPFYTDLIEQLTVLEQAAQSVPYPCKALAVIPLGEKGRKDVNTLIEATLSAERRRDESGEAEPKLWGNPQIFFEPTYPRPGLYRTFRPGSEDGGQRPIVTPLTYLLAPDRTILAIRTESETGSLYEWLQVNLPESITIPPKRPTTDISYPPDDLWVWPGFRRTLQREALAARAPNTLPFMYLAWQRRVGATFSSPVAAGGRVYVATDGLGLRVVSLASGGVLGNYDTGQSWWTSPAIAGDLVYCISSEGDVQALDRLKLELKWETRLRSLVTSSPLVCGGVLYVGARNGVVYALDAANGDVLWQFQTGGEVSSSPALRDGVLVIGSGDRHLYALNASDGTQRWSFATGGAVDSSPTIHDSDVLVGSFDGNLYSLRLSDGQLNWKCELGGWVHSSPAVAGDTVFVGTVNVRRDQKPTFNWIDLQTGARKGFFEMPQAVYSSPTVWENLVLVGCRDGQLYGFDREMKQTQPLMTFATRGYVHASPVVVGDTMLVASYDGNLYALRQSKPIEVWTEQDVVPRWFMAALAMQLHLETAELTARAATSDVGTALTLTKFDEVFRAIRGKVAKPEQKPRVLPRDVPPDHPGAPFVEYVLTAGLLGGYPDGTFLPNDPATRYQFASALASVLSIVTRPDFTWRVLKEHEAGGAQVEVRVVPLDEGMPRGLPSDVNLEHWAAQSLKFLADNALLQVQVGEQFRGQRPATLRDAQEQWDLVAKAVQVMRTR